VSKQAEFKHGILPPAAREILISAAKLAKTCRDPKSRVIILETAHQKVRAMYPGYFK
jgi:PIN domain nuclease of toxin-antitoxin system